MLFFCPSALFSSQFPNSSHAYSILAFLHTPCTYIQLLCCLYLQQVRHVRNKIPEVFTWSSPFRLGGFPVADGDESGKENLPSLTAFGTIALAAVIQILLVLFEQVPLLVPSLFHCLFFKRSLETNTHLRWLCLKTSLYHKSSSSRTKDNRWISAKNLGPLQGLLKTLGISKTAI